MTTSVHPKNTVVPLACAVVLLAVAFASRAGEPPKESVQEFVITWENAGSFEDQPKFDDRELDKKENRFQVPKEPGDPYCFKSGHVSVPAPAKDLDSSASKIGDAIAYAVFGDRSIYRVGKPVKTRFGYFVSVDWGSKEEHYTGHILRAMIDFDKRVIWWDKCD